uniref:Uncharacterized protein n=1 Tax=Ditylenchus dipsaci TaxID=166011 RepID=A0A915ECH6_9BILA
MVPGDALSTFSRCAATACHGTAKSVFEELNDLVERKSHDRYQEKMTAVKRKAVESLATSTPVILSSSKTGASVYEIEQCPRTATSKE